MPYVYPAVRQIVHTSLVLKCRHKNRCHPASLTDAFTLEFQDRVIYPFNHLNIVVNPRKVVPTSPSLSIFFLNMTG